MDSAMAKTSTSNLGTAMADALRFLSDAFLGSYRPELHYMRGPGPKWREKHAIDALRSGFSATRRQRSRLERFVPHDRGLGLPEANLAAWSVAKLKPSARLRAEW
jgi:hypothetical protein